VKQYPHYKIYEAKDLRDLMRRAVNDAPDKAAFAYQLGERVYSHTYSQFKADVESLGTYFYSIGLKNGAKIAVMGENSYLWIVTYFAVTTGGNVVVPLDKELPPDEILGLLRDSGAEAAVYSDDYANMFESFSENRRKQNLGVKRYINMKQDLPLAITQGADMISSHGAREFIDHKLDADAVCAIVYTSGTTGIAKGVMLTNKSIVATTREALRIAHIYGDTVLLLPLHHTYPISASVLPCFFYLTTCFINSNLRHVLRDIQTAKPQFLCVVPLYVESFHKKIWEGARSQGKEGILRKMIVASKSARKVGIDVRRVLFGSVLKAFGGKLDLLVSGGAPLNKNYIDELGYFGIQILEGYGITECSPIVALNRNKFWKPGSVGIAIPNNEVKIFDINKDGTGEICVRGNIVMKGYYNNPQATQSAFIGDWFRTGDIGYVDDDGFIFITGRMKNVIIRANGKNVHPEELEEKFSVIQHIKELMVYGEGEDIVAEIFIDPEQDRKQCEKTITKKVKEINGQLPIYKRVNKIKFRDVEFDKTTTKKIKRYNLKRQKD
jgi:long-chain acyl-CoA synthetase